MRVGTDVLAILAGIDEAGFGPTLGPLIVSGTVFRVPDDRLDISLWDALRETCSDSPRHVKRRLVITDSKKLHRPGMGVDWLERTALAMLRVAGFAPQTLREFIERVAPRRNEHLDRYPWYAEQELSLPIGRESADLGPIVNAIRRQCRLHNLAFQGVYSEPLSAGAFNRMVTSTKNKAVVLMGLALRIVDRILRDFPNERVRLLVDRLGGRTHYRPALMTSFPGFDLQVLEETPERSAYALNSVPRSWHIEFITQGDAKQFPVALASIYSKYIRELHMHLFNTYWAGRIPGLKSTAGYYTDAHRWLREVETELHRSGIDRSILIRNR